MQPVRTHYANRAGVSIAYQVVGEGPVDLVFSPGFISHLDLQWGEPRMAAFLRRLASFSRLILYDKPGTGLSDPIPDLPSVEERAADILAVMDAAGSERATVFGLSDGGPAAIVLAATRPDRVTSLVLCNTFAAGRPLDEYSPEARELLTRSLEKLGSAIEHWGDPAGLEFFAPSRDSEMLRRFYAIFARAAASPRMVRALLAAAVRLDVRPVLGTVRVPTLVLHTVGDQMIPIDAGRLIARSISGAELVEVPGQDHVFWLSDWECVAEHTERFVSGTIGAPAPDRALATLLFTDVVGSTAQAAAVGDEEWRRVLEQHDALARAQVDHHHGRVVKHMGDGMLAVFDGPARAIAAAQGLRAAVEPLGVAIRAGVHTGEVERIGDDVSGMAVHIGARVSGLADANEVLVSGTVRDLVVGSRLRFMDRGEHELKGVPGRWRVYAVGEAPQDGRAIDAATDHMRAGDRLMVTMARRAPRTMRFGARVLTRGRS